MLGHHGMADDPRSPHTTPIEKGVLPPLDPDRPIVLVPLNQVPDLTYLRVDRRTGELDLSESERSLHPNDRQPLEVAFGIRDAAMRDATDDDATPQVLVASVDHSTAQDGLREALAMGADGGVLLASRAMAHSDALARANFFAQLVRRLPRCDAVLVGSETMEPDWSTIGGALAAILGWTLVPGGDRIRLTERGTSGLAMFGAHVLRYDAEGPAVITVRPETTRPRWATSWSIAEAYREKRITSLDLTDLEVDGRMLARMQSHVETRAQRIETPRPKEAEVFTDPPEQSARVIGKRLARMGFLGGF